MWFDAPIGYLGATREWADATTDSPESAEARFESWWRTDRGAADVTYTEFMGKDNVPFHTLGFPATILGSGEDWKLVDRLKSFNWLTYYGGKFSTSERRGVFMSDALECRPGRLLAVVPHGQRPGVRRRQLHVGPVRRGGQQGPRRHVRATS